MAITTGNAVPSSLRDVLECVRDLFSAAADSTPIMVGAAYQAQFGAGSPPRVLFVPEEGGSIREPLKIGNEAAYTHGCDVYVRAEEGGDDLTRHDKTYDLVSRVVSALKRAGGGLLKFTGKAGDSSPTDNDAFGAEVSFHFEFTRDIQKDATIYGVRRQAPTTVAAYPNPPPGQPATDVSINPTATPSN